MQRYSVFGLTVDSEIQLIEPEYSGSGPADVVIRLGEVPTVSRKSTLDDELLQIRSTAAIHIRNGSEIIVHPSADAQPELLPLLLTGRLMAYLLRQRGWLPLHASSVRIGDHAVLFTGPVGAGKSTTAAGFHARDYTVLSDDVSPVRVLAGTCLVRQGRSRLRLCDDAAEAFSSLDPTAGFVFDKHYFNLGGNVLSRHFPVRRIYLLQDGAQFGIEPVRAIDAVPILGKECFTLLRRAGPDVLAAHLKDCSEVAGLSLMRRLIRPRNLALLDQLVHLVEQDIAG